MCNLYGGMRGVVHLLYEKGYRKIALMTGPCDVYCMDQRDRGYLDEVQTLGLAYQNVLAAGGRDPMNPRARGFRR